MTIRHPFQQGFRKAWQSLPLILCLVTLPACNEQQAAPPPPGPPPAPVRVVPVLQQELQQTVTLVGTVEPWKRSIVASEVEGLVQAFPAEEGMAVKRGQLLARLRTKTLRIQFDSALALYREAGARYQQAKRNLSRIRVLFKQELVTQKDFDDARAEETALKEHLSQLHAEIRQVKDSLNQSQIVAPFDGWITQEFTEVGQWVEEGGAIIEMVDLSHVKVEIPLPERYVSTIQIQDPVTATFDSLPEFEAQGQSSLLLPKPIEPREPFRSKWRFRILHWRSKAAWCPASRSKSTGPTRGSWSRRTPWSSGEVKSLCFE